MEAFEIVENAVVGHAGEFHMALRVGLLDIVEEEIDGGEDALQMGKGDGAARFDGAVEALGGRRLQQGGGEADLAERLSAGEGYATVGDVVEGAIFEQFLHDLGNGCIPSHDFQALCVTTCGTGAAGKADGAIEGVLSVFHAVGVLRAVFEAVAAADAFFRLEGEERMVCLSLGVMAPEAGEGAALEENGGAYAGAVVDRETLYFEDAADCIRHRRTPCAG